MMPGWSKLSAEFMHDLEQRVIALLGDTYQDLVDERARGIRSSMPPKKPHRLVSNVRRLAASRQTLEQGRGDGGLDVAAIIEVRTLLSLVEPWRGHASWPSIVASLVDGDSYAHTVVMLTTAKLYSDSGYLVQLEPPSPDRRSFDLRLLAGEGQTAAIEVKAPSSLRQGSSRKITRDDARKVVFNAMEKAGTSAGGQLAPDRCGILVIGGLGLKQVDVDNLGRGADDLFRRRWLSHIDSILILSLGTHINGPHIVEGTTFVGPGSSAQAVLKLRYCRNARYLGVVVIKLGRPSGWSDLGPHTEMEIPDHPFLSRYR